jgi:hypothetical protein
MQDEGRFRETYLALVALNWSALERIDGLLIADEDGWATPASEGRLQWLRLELLQLGESAARCAMMRRLSRGQHQLLQGLIGRILEWLDFDSKTTREIVRLRLAAAQNWLLEEAGRMGRGDETPELTRRRG